MLFTVPIPMVHADDLAVGDNTSYFLDPHGDLVECTTELDLLDEDTWHLTVYGISRVENQDHWGTADPFGEVVAEKGFNDVDRGPSVAPPV